MRIRPDFHMTEFVPPEVWTRYEDGEVDPRWFVRPELLDLAQGIRERYGRPMWINTWYRDAGGKKNRGYRIPSTGVGAEWSMHKLGCAIDFNVEGMPPDETREDIMSNQETFYRKGLRAIEHGDYAETWVHADIRPTELENEILVVTPS